VSVLLELTRYLLACAIVIGCGVWVMVGANAFSFRARKHRLASMPWSTHAPPVTLLKPVYGLEKQLRANLRSACTQDYPIYQVVFSVQRKDDPAIGLLLELQSEFGAQRVTVAIEDVLVGLNGKINNLTGALPHARHDVLVISDSDVWLAPDYLRRIVAPLSDPSVGAVSSFFRAVRAERWFERFELLTINADHMALAMLGQRFRGDLCFGASCALTRGTLDSIGGFGVLGDYLVEDTELGRRILRSGKQLAVIPYVVDTMVDQASFAGCWQKQTYWDQNTRAAVPAVFAASLFVRVIPLALLYAALAPTLSQAWLALGAAFVCRLGAAAAALGCALQDREGLTSLWLVPLKDCLSLFWFARAWLSRTLIWRGVEMGLTPDGRLCPLPITAALAEKARTP
jgi:ceramide glucosyltransferase